MCQNEWYYLIFDVIILKIFYGCSNYIKQNSKNSGYILWNKLFKFVLTIATVVMWGCSMFSQGKIFFESFKYFNKVQFSLALYR